MFKKLELSASTLHIIAMVLMLMDHTWAALLPQYEILTCIGRMTFPVFAFLLVNGFEHTGDIKKYMLRMLGFALISEIPFDFVYAGTWFYPYHQNVLWTMLLGLIMLYILDKFKDSKWYFKLPVYVLLPMVCMAISLACMLDYYHTGMITIFIFYLFRKRRPLDIILTVLILYYFNTEILGGYYYNIELFGFHIELVQQSLAVLALIPIFMYRGKKGLSSKWFKYLCYSFYPLHLVALYLIYYLQYNVY